MVAAGNADEGNANEGIGEEGKADAIHLFELFRHFPPHSSHSSRPTCKTKVIQTKVLETKVRQTQYISLTFLTLPPSFVSFISSNTQNEGNTNEGIGEEGKACAIHFFELF